MPPEWAAFLFAYVDLIVDAQVNSDVFARVERAQPLGVALFALRLREDLVIHRGQQRVELVLALRVGDVGLHGQCLHIFDVDNRILQRGVVAAGDASADGAELRPLLLLRRGRTGAAALGAGRVLGRSQRGQQQNSHCNGEDSFHNSPILSGIQVRCRKAAFGSYCKCREMSWRSSFSMWTLTSGAGCFSSVLIT